MSLASCRQQNVFRGSSMGDFMRVILLLIDLVFFVKCDCISYSTLG